VSSTAPSSASSATVAAAGSNDRALMITIEHRADLLIQLRPLASGYSKDVHGQVHFLLSLSIVCSLEPHIMSRPLP
jgi:hypothetical protein